MSFWLVFLLSSKGSKLPFIVFRQSTMRRINFRSLHFLVTKGAARNERITPIALSGPQMTYCY